MTTAEALANGLQEINEDYIAESVADYIECPSSPDCAYDGSNNHMPCTDCKVKWLRSVWEN